MSNFKKNALFFIISFLSFSTTFAQTGERFIKIVGNSKAEYVSDGLALYLTVAEIQPNEYRQVRYKPIETVFQTLVSNVVKLGYKEADLKRDLRTSAGAGYQAVKSERYVINVTDADQAAKLMKSDMEGVTLSEIKYVFKAPGVEAEESLAIEAIKDAERKAKRLVKEIGKKIGKILNLEDKSSGCCREIEDNKDRVVTKQYKLNVTFELID